MPDKKNKRLHLGDEGYLEENPLRVFRSYTLGEACLLYTSDAADE